MRTGRTLFHIVAIILLISSDPIQADTNGGIAAVTIPSADITLSFVQPGRIAKVLVKDGDQVISGQLLIQQDDAAEQAQLLQLKAESENTSQIEASEASLAQKKVDLKRIDWVAQRGSATELEVEHARLEVVIAELSLKVAKFEYRQSELKYKEAQIRVDNMSLTSPITGTVDIVEVEVGESVNGLADVVRVVKTDPLWIDVAVPVAQAKRLKLGQIANINFKDTNGKPATGKVVYVSTVADAASSSMRARIELPNKTRPAGEHVRITFPTLGK